MRRIKTKYRRGVDRAGRCRGGNVRGVVVDTERDDGGCRTGEWTTGFGVTKRD